MTIVYASDMLLRIMNESLVYKEPEHVIDAILSDLVLYENPDLLKPEYQSIVATLTLNIDLIKKHSTSLLNVRAAWQKALRYEVYFAEFYPTSNSIPVFEALNHHVHGYLQDMTTLRNKIEVWLGEFKNDSKKEFENKKDVEEFYDAAIAKTQEVFGGVTKHRDTHQHKGPRFLDPDILKAETAHFASEFISNPKFPLPLNQAAVPDILAKLQKNENEAFEIAKERWVKTAHDNGVQATGYLNSVLALARPNLCRLLGIRPMIEIFSKGASLNTEVPAKE